MTPATPTATKHGGSRKRDELTEFRRLKYGQALIHKDMGIVDFTGIDRHHNRGPIRWLHPELKGYRHGTPDQFSFTTESSHFEKHRNAEFPTACLHRIWQPLDYRSGVSCGVYFLIGGKKLILYVGQSVNILNRVASHVTCMKFSGVNWIKVCRSRLDEVERLLIDALKPEGNKQGVPP